MKVHKYCMWYMCITKRNNKSNFWEELHEMFGKLTKIAFLEASKWKHISEPNMTILITKWCTIFGIHITFLACVLTVNGAEAIQKHEPELNNE